jgi:hypothetical protein
MLQQQLYLREGYKYPPSSTSSYSSQDRKNIIVGATKFARSPPSTNQSSWSLENQTRRPWSTSSPKRFDFSSHLLAGFMPRGFLETLGLYLLDKLVYCLSDSFVLILGDSNSVVNVCPKLCVKAPFRLEEPLESWARPLWRKLTPENMVRPLWHCLGLCGDHTPPT